MPKLTDTQILKIAEILKAGCLVSNDEAKEHTKILNIIPGKIDDILKNQEKMLSETSKNFAKIVELEKYNYNNVDKINENERYITDIYKRLNACETNVVKLFTGRKVFFSVVAVSMSVFAFLADWIYKIIKG